MLAQPATQGLQRLLRSQRHAAATDTWQSYTLHVQGMGCGKCAAKVTTLLESMDFHRAVRVDLANATVHLEATCFQPDIIAAKLKTEGYDWIPDQPK
jgi:copper chaperone CopZ